jgi:putative ABC transport system permease protein
VVSGSAPIVFGNTNWTTSIDGVSVDCLELRDWHLTEGRKFTDAELRSAAKVLILGATTARELFGDAPVIGQQVQVMNVPFTVVGLLPLKGQSEFGTDQDDTAIVPVTTARRPLFGAADNLKRIMVEVASAEEINDDRPCFANAAMCAMARPTISRCATWPSSSAPEARCRTS